MTSDGAAWIHAVASYRQVLERANEGIWVLDLAGQVLFANDKMAEIVGYQPGELTGSSAYDLLDDPGKEQLRARLEQHRDQGGSTDSVECCFLCKDGSRVWVQVSRSPLHDADGRAIAAVSVITDITRRRTVESRLRDRERQLAESQRVAHLGSWLWNVASNTVTWSDELYRIFGLAPQELAPTFEAYLSRVHPDDRGMVTEQVGRSLESGQAFEHEIRVIRPDGELVWVESRGQVERDESGVVVRLFGTGQDITATKRIETALRSASAHSRLLQAVASGANQALTVEDALQVALDEICAHSGWGLGHVYADDGVSLTALPVWHVDPTERYQALRASVEASPPLSLPGAFALRAPVGAGETYVLEFLGDSPIEPEDAFLTTVQQVVDVLRRVADRARTAAELAAARDAAMEASRLKSEFLATMSHEIRTPMNGVIGLTDLLLRTDLEPLQRQYAAGVHNSGEALLAIINDILDFSKIEAGCLELEVRPFDLLDVVERAADTLSEPATAKHLELIAGCHADLPTALRGDAVRLSQVLINLIANAVKFTESGEVVVHARQVAADGDAIVVEFTVTDTGIGMSPAQQQRLFEPFSQADASTTRLYGGTGLGLAISGRLVQAMGGRLEVDTELAGGSTFRFGIPLQRQSGQPSHVPRPGEHLLIGARVLVVDDNTSNRVAVFQQLTAWRLRPGQAATSAAALLMLRRAAARGEPYQVALVDQSMPDVEGADLIREVLADESLAATGLVLLSPAGAEQRDSAVAGLATLSKPVRQSQLHDCLIELIVAVGAKLPSPPLSGLARPVRGRLLLVEDNPTNQLVALGVVRELGFLADVAADGRQALDALARSGYAAILMDCQMPGMDGYAATREIRRIEAGGRRTPVIAMTAAAVEGDRALCVAAGMDDYISKPMLYDDVAAALARWVKPTVAAGGATQVVVVPVVVAPVAVDEERLETLRMINPADPALLGTLVDGFLTEAPGLLADMRSAADSGDCAALATSSHRLRGAALTMGLPAVAAVSGELESLGGTGRIAGATELLARVAADLATAAAALPAAAGRAHSLPKCGGTAHSPRKSPYFAGKMGVMTQPPEGLTRYRLFTGPDDITFCHRVSEALDMGYVLHGSPSLTHNGTNVVAGQALIWPYPE